MKKTHVYVIEMDSVGRFVLPRDMRAQLGLVANSKNYITCTLVGNKIIIQKYEPACIFCGETENVFEFQNKYICENCKKQLDNL